MGLENIQLNNVTLATPSEVDRIRYPEQLFTDGYLDDPIEFRPDARFRQRSLVEQLDVLPNQIERDFADFLQVNGANNKNQYLAINLYSPVWSRVQFERVISPSRKAFTQLGIRRA